MKGRAVGPADEDDVETEAMIPLADPVVGVPAEVEPVDSVDPDALPEAEAAEEATEEAAEATDDEADEAAEPLLSIADTTLLDNEA